MADTVKTADAINAETARLTAEAARLNAETALLTAQRVRASADRPTDALQELQRQRSTADAEKELANATTDARIAQTVGAVKSAAFTGAVELKEKSGLLEAQLLATKAIRDAAETIGAVVSEEANVKEVVLCSARTFTSFDRLANYRIRRELTKTALEALVSPTKQQFGAEASGMVAAPAVLSAGIDAAAKLLSFFKSDYTVGGIDATLDESVALYAVAGSLALRGVIVRMSATTMPAPKQKVVDNFLEEMRELFGLRCRIDEQILVLEAQRSEMAAAAVVAEGNGQPKLQTTALDAQSARLKEAIAVYDSFIAALSTPEAQSGTMPFVALVNDLFLEKLLTTDSPLLLVRLETTGGGYLLKKNLWTGLGAPPLYHMGGAALSYLLVDRGGQVLRGGTVAVHGGYMRSAKLAKDLRAAINVTELSASALKAAASARRAAESERNAAESAEKAADSERKAVDSAANASQHATNVGKASGGKVDG